MKNKMKRKELLEDEFSDFSLSSPATKIRRIDAELPPIMEEDEPENTILFEKLRTPILEELPCVPQNDERAMVVFKPINTPLHRPLSSYSLSIDPNIISGFKSGGIWSSGLNRVEVVGKEEEEERNKCLAVVPWVAHPLKPELMVVEEEETSIGEESSSMEIEEDPIETEGGGAAANQWQQHHCMMTPITHDTSPPIVWYR